MAEPEDPPRSTLRRSIVTTPWPWILRTALVGVLGVALIAGAFAYFQPHLPPLIPSHVGADGSPDAWTDPTTFLEVMVGTSIAVTGLFAVLVAWIGRSPALLQHHGAGFGKSLLAFHAAVVGFGLPATFAIILSTATNGPLPGSQLGNVLLAVNVGPILLVGLWTVLPSRGHGAALPAIGAPDPGGTQRGRVFPVGTELRCSACGEPFGLDHVSLLTPHLFTGGRGSLYTRCPACGERGWNAVVGRASAEPPP